MLTQHSSMLIKCVCGYLCWMGCFNLSLRSYEMGGPIKPQQVKCHWMPLSILRHANSVKVAITTRLIHTSFQWLVESVLAVMH